MLAGQLANTLEVLGRQFPCELPGSFGTAGLRYEHTVFRNQNRSVPQIANTKCETRRLRPDSNPAIQGGLAAGGVQQRHDNTSPGIAHGP